MCRGPLRTAHRMCLLLTCRTPHPATLGDDSIRKYPVKSKRRDSQQTVPSGRYAAKLLFQYRVMVDGSPGARRLCEERIITISATHGQAALQEAKRRGRTAQHRYKSGDGNPVHFEFIGVMELLRLDPACDDDEVWYEIKERVRPSERRASIIPPESSLSAIRNYE